jgi:hypothetical protein
VIKERSNSWIISGFWCKSGPTLGLILLLSSVCALLIVVNCDKSGVNCDGIKGYQGYQGRFSQSGHVSLFHLPTRHESGSYAQIPNDARGNSVFDFPCFSFQK